MAIINKAQKMESMKEAFAEDTIKGVLRIGLGDRSEIYLAALSEAYKKWNISSPEQWRYVVENWCDKLFHSITHETIEFFLNSSAEEFETRIRQATRAIENKSPTVPEWISDEHHTLLALDHERQQTLRESLKSRRLDQRLYYMNVDSAQVWNDLINMGDYRQYDSCRDALRVLVHGSEWSRRTSTGDIGAIVMLGGGGSASKDVEILRSLEKEATASDTSLRVRYILLDVSSHMLSISVSRIKRFFRRNPEIRPRACVQAVVADILNLRQIDPSLLRTAERKNAWFLTGGTIGNLSEAGFFQALNHVAKAGDLLVVGIDTFDAADKDYSAAAIKSKYRPDAMQEFLATPISMLLHLTDSEESTRKLRSGMEVVVVDGRKLGYSDIDNTLTAEVRLVLGPSDEYVLLTSTRYHLETFVAWCESRGWHLLGTYSPPENDVTFRQLLFERGT